MCRVSFSVQRVAERGGCVCYSSPAPPCRPSGKTFSTVGSWFHTEYTRTHLIEGLCACFTKSRATLGVAFPTDGPSRLRSLPKHICVRRVLHHLICKSILYYVYFFGCNKARSRSLGWGIYLFALRASETLGATSIAVRIRRRPRLLWGRHF